MSTYVDYFTYRGVDIHYHDLSHFWADAPHGYGDDCRPHGHAKTLREAMDAIDEYRHECWLAELPDSLRAARVSFHVDGGGIRSLRRYHATRARLRLMRRPMTYRGDCISLTGRGTLWVWGLGLEFDSLGEALAAIEGQFQLLQRTGT